MNVALWIAQFRYKIWSIYFSFLVRKLLIPFNERHSLCSPFNWNDWWWLSVLIGLNIFQTPVFQLRFPSHSINTLIGVQNCFRTYVQCVLSFSCDDILSMLFSNHKLFISLLTCSNSCLTFGVFHPWKKQEQDVWWVLNGKDQGFHPSQSLLMPEKDRRKTCKCV